MTETTNAAGLDDEPLRFGPFVVAASGELALVGAGATRFSLAWRDRVVEAELRATPAAPDGALSLRVLAGAVPSSADGPAASERRETLFAALRSLPPLLPPDWRIGLTPDHQVRVSAEQLVTAPLSAVGLTTGLATFLQTLTPYLELLAECGAGRPCGHPA